MSKISRVHQLMMLNLFTMRMKLSPNQIDNHLFLVKIENLMESFAMPGRANEIPS